MRYTFARMVAAVALAVASLGAGVTAAEAAPAAAPTIGLNDWSCRPSSAAREPVVMLHGLGANGGLNWFTKAPLITAGGYCVFTPTYGVGALGIGGLRSMRTSAAEVGAFVERVRAETGAAKVNIVGHSEGTTVAAYYMKFLGGDATVRNFVGSGSNYRGTTLYGLSTLARALPGVTDLLLDGLCDSCNEFLPPSDFLTDLGAGGVTVPGPRYTNIVTRYDEVVLPYTSGVLAEPGVTNIVLQDRCWLDFSGHLALAIDPNVTSHILWALNGQSGRRPGCVPFVAPA